MNPAPARSGRKLPRGSRQTQPGRADMALLLSRGAGSALAVSMMASCIGVLDCPSAAAQDFSEFPVPNLLAFGGSDVGAPIHGIGAGPDGNLWFTEYGASALARITTGGSVT